MREVFGRAMRVGRDHIASTVNTLFLAYAGASLTLLIVFSTSGASAGEIINSERFAEELVKTLVGSIGLIAAVPLTTALAATVAVRRPRPTAPPRPPVGTGDPDEPVDSEPGEGPVDVDPFSDPMD
jgi:uncharacterized membrane protein